MNRRARSGSSVPENGDPNRGRLADRFREFADWCRGTSPLYERLARGVAADGDLLALAARTPKGRSPPHLLLAAVHARLLAGADHHLRRFYATCVGNPADPTETDPVPDFRDFALGRAHGIGETLRTRRTQTNAVRRCGALYPGFAAVYERTGAPLHLLEVGASAGLNLCWDRYAYDYGGRRVGVESECAVATEVRGDRIPPLPADPPPVASRVGVDLNPLDVTDAGDVRWLRALVWPGHRERHRLLRAAVAVARADPPEVVAGDALDRLPDLLARVPGGEPAVVFDTQVLYQFADGDRRRFCETLANLGRTRPGPLFWLCGERPGDPPRSIRLELGRPGERDGEGTARELLARYEQHGRWIEWRGGEAVD